PILEKRFGEKTRDEWLAILAAHDIPAAPVKTVLEFMNDPAVQHHDMVHEYDHPDVGRLRLMGQPIAFTDTPTRDPGPPPLLGQHTDQVLKEAGYDAATTNELRAKKVVR
ncbi:MAG TPA: CoA transferase, partial [Ktedonobacterales bacterium]|nr:CoA transferase [Ktedonobacterales bacterium]